MISYELNQEIKQAINIIELMRLNGFEKIYSCTNENINGYINDFDLEGNSLLTVGSSLDQVINTILYGCRDITVIDLCPFVKHYFNLKKAALLTLNYDQFQTYFYEIDKHDFDLFNRKTYFMLRDKLGKIDYLSLLFWDALYNKYNEKTIRYRLFQNDAFETDCITEYNPYLMTERNYNSLRLKIRNIHPRFINGNILDLDYYLDKEKFDNVFLSNVYDYQSKDEFLLQRFKELISKIDNRLNEDGKALIAYLYGTNTNSKLSDFKQNNIYSNLTYTNFKGVRGMYFDNDIKDTAVILEKKKK